MYLSQLASSSPWSIASGKVLANMARRPFSCLLFYFESALLAAICTAAGVWSAQYHHLAPVLLAPLYVAALLLFCRLMGRLAWRIAGPREEEKDAAGEKRRTTPDGKQNAGEPLARG
jgi:hypothetical protein